MNGIKTLLLRFAKVTGIFWQKISCAKKFLLLLPCSMGIFVRRQTIRLLSARVLLVFLVFFLFSSNLAFAEEIKIVFTGQAHAALYPCDCPKDRSGGVARRAGVIEKIRSESKNVLLIEAGASLGSGDKDDSRQNLDLDRSRSAIYLDSLKTMGYDVLLANSEEFVFGLDFLKKYKEIPFISSNLEGFERPYVIKNFGWMKVGVIGFSDAVAGGLNNLKWVAPSAVLKGIIASLKKQGVDFVILLSGLNPEEDETLLRKTKGIDLVINGGYSLGSVDLKYVEGAMYLKTWWQARSVGVLSLDFSAKALKEKKLESIKLDQKIADDEKVASLVPACFQGDDCKPVFGSATVCQDAGAKKARCVYTAIPKVKLTIIKPLVCRTCHIDPVVANLNRVFENLEIESLAQDSEKAKVFIKEFDITMLPVYLLDKSISGLKQFPDIKSHFIEGKDAYFLKPSDSGVSYLLRRDKIAKRLDVIFDFSYHQAPALFELLKAFKEKHADYDLRLNFLVIRNKDGEFVSRGGASEIEEFRRIACIDHLYHEELFNYLICRSRQKGLSWWGECAIESHIDTLQLKACVSSEGGRADFQARIALPEELQIINGPTFIIDNREIFAIVNVPALEEFEKTVIDVAEQE